MKAFSRAPLRIGIAGGGTDLDVYFKEYGGLVVNSTISLYMHCEIETIEGKDLIIFESIDLKSKSIYDSKKKIKFDGKMDLYKAVYNKIVSKYIKKKISIKLTTRSDVPMGSGLGGSSTLVVAMVKAYDTLFELELTKREIAELSYDIERNDTNIAGGYQDQYTASYGGINIMHFPKDDKVQINALKIKKSFLDKLEKSILLYYTNISRSANQIESEKNSLIHKKKSIKSMHKIKNDALEAKDAIENSDLMSLAKIISKTWQNKKNVSSMVSNEKIDNIYNLALDNGAHGAKVSGAGGGGFIFFITDLNRISSLKRLLSKQEGKLFPFGLEKNGVIGWKE